MNTNDIREMVAKAQIEPAVTALIEISADDDLKQLSLEISRSYKTYKRNCIAGILNNDQQRQEMAIITYGILNLVSEFELSQIRILKDNVGLLKIEVEKSGMPDTKEFVNDLVEIQNGLNDANAAGSKKEIKPQVSEKLKSLHEKLEDPNSKESKIIKNIKEGFKIAGQIISIMKIVFF
jgi:hypothetical protein